MQTKLTNIALVLVMISGVSVAKDFPNNNVFIAANVEQVVVEPLVPSPVVAEKIAGESKTEDLIDELYSSSSNNETKAAKVIATSKSESLLQLAQKVDKKPLIIATDTESKEGDNADLSYLWETQRKINLYKGETYRDGLRRVFEKFGYTQVAWSVSDEMRRQLNKTVPEKKEYSGNFQQVMKQIQSDTKDGDLEFYVSVDHRNGIGAVHEWGDRVVRIVEVRGETLKDTVKNLVLDFGWNWNDKSSWRVKDDDGHGFAVDFPIVAPSDDIRFAIDRILKGRSVRADIHDGTKSVFIVKDK